MRLRAVLTAVMAFSGVAFAQGGHVDLPAIFSQSSSPMQIPGLNITVCLSTASGVPCSPTVSVFSDQALTQPIANLQTNGDGLFPFWISPGTYQYCASGGSITTFCNPFTVGIAPGSSPSFTTITISGSAKFAETTAPGCLVGFDFLFGDSTAHRLKQCDNNGSPVQLVNAGVDINTSDQVTGTHLTVPLPAAQGGTGQNSTAVFPASGTIQTGTGTTNKLGKYTNGPAGVEGDSAITDDGVKISSTEPYAEVEAAAPSGIAASDLFYADSTAHRWKMINNNGSADSVVGAATTDALSGKSFSTGIAQGSGFKHQRFGATCTTGAAAGNTCTTAYTWTSAFADTSYTTTCAGVAASGTNAILTIASKSASQVTVTLQTPAAIAASFGEVDCIAIHD